jgi:hypothetical protein
MMRRAVTGVIVGVALLASAGGQAAQAAERPSWRPSRSGWWSG